ncbi:hypothetical protein AUP43_11235 [Oceanibaculum pacificum]|uniref:Uncharacterized protein n=1 Tax=Oceanibaculum pacificum TaxID=580166 RepID=A0A154VY87_9PROT|nr:hypothetical protein AUP43_11235 [Oceanibaculum pacificum]
MSQQQNAQCTHFHQGGASSVGKVKLVLQQFLSISIALQILGPEERPAPLYEAPAFEQIRIRKRT